MVQLGYFLLIRVKVCWSFLHFGVCVGWCYFLDIVSSFCLGHPHACSSCLCPHVGTTGLCHHTPELFLLRWISLSFPPCWLWIKILSVFTSWVAGITVMHHCTWLFFFFLGRVLYIAYVGLKLVILLIQPPEFWDNNNRYMLPCPGNASFLKYFSLLEFLICFHNFHCYWNSPLLCTFSSFLLYHLVFLSHLFKVPVE
jgi:hypothetical protein